MKRRDLLRVSSVALAGMAGNPATSSAAGESAGTRKRVLVIGGGIAGLSCAYELMRLGHNVTVLEASGRAGGQATSRSSRRQHPRRGFAEVS